MRQSKALPTSPSPSLPRRGPSLSPLKGGEGLFTVDLPLHKTAAVQSVSVPRTALRGYRGQGHIMQFAPRGADRQVRLDRLALENRRPDPGIDKEAHRRGREDCRSSGNVGGLSDVAD